MPETKPPRPLAVDVMLGALAVFVVIMLLLGATLGVYAGFKSVGRAQHRADAKNQVSISEIEIRNQAQRIKVAQQKAEIRLQDAIGVREAQDEIAKTLTPLYVQFEMVDALKAIATSGNNNTVVYTAIEERFRVQRIIAISYLDRAREAGALPPAGDPQLTDEQRAALLPHAKTEPAA